jgi:hypothetical protein
MTLVPLAPQPGLNSDDTAFSSAGRYIDGNNVRFYEGKPQVIEGWSAPATIAAGGGCNGIAVLKVGSSYRALYGMTSKTYASSAGSLTTTISDITAVGVPAGGTITSWAFDAFGAVALFVPSGSTLYKYTGAGVATEVTQAPDAITDMLVTAQRQVLAFGCNEEVSTTFNGLCIRGSDLEDYTNWTTSATNNAFEHILEGSGSIVAARRVGSYVVVWTQAKVYLGQYIGDPSQTYRFDIIDDVAGPTSRDAVCVVNASAYWMGTDLSLHQYTPGALPFTIPCPIRNELLANYDPGAAPYDRMVALPVYLELWFFYADTRDNASSGSRYVAYSIAESARAERPVWFRGSMPRTAICVSPIINSLDQAPLTFLAANDLHIFKHGDTTGVAYDGGGVASSISPSITVGDMYLDNAARRTMITRIIPDFSGQIGDISLTAYMRDRPQSTAVTIGPYTLSVGATKKDFRASGMIGEFKFSSSAALSAFRFGKPCLDVVATGQR